MSHFTLEITAETILVSDLRSSCRLCILPIIHIFKLQLSVYSNHKQTFLLFIDISFFNQMFVCVNDKYIYQIFGFVF